LVFADPWYEDELDIAGWEELLAPEGILILEHSSMNELPQNPNLKNINHKRYGDTSLTFYIHA
jgi:16S rRNA G966 N2-methylase RsmD